MPSGLLRAMSDVTVQGRPRSEGSVLGPRNLTVRPISFVQCNELLTCASTVHGLRDWLHG